MHMGHTNVNNDYAMTNCTGETQTISDCTEEKDLGVLFDNRLSFELEMIRNTFKFSFARITGAFGAIMLRPHWSAIRRVET